MEKQRDRLQLFLLPFAGGNANSFRNLLNYLDAEIEAVPIEYAGRGTRVKEDFILDYCAFLDDAAESIRKKRDMRYPYAILGYSLGSALVYDLLVKEMLQDAPLHVFICAREALYHDSDSRKYSELPEEEFVERIVQMGGMDPRILENRRFLQIFMRPIQADYQVWKQYQFCGNDKKLTEDITVFYSEQDTPYPRVEGWKTLTSGDVKFYEFGKTHFFINDFYREMAAIINAALVQKKGV